MIEEKGRKWYDLRVFSEILLKSPPGKSLATLGDRAFAFAARKLWNSLPKDIRNIKFLSSLRSSIKTFLFKRAFNM